MDVTRIAIAVALFLVAGVCEIGGGWFFWKWRKEGWGWWCIFPGAALLIVYGMIPTLQKNTFGRTFAAYGGFFILLSLLWAWATEGTRPDKWDIIGAAIALVGVSVIMFVKR